MFDYNKNIGMINSRLAQSVHDAQVVGGSLSWAPIKKCKKPAHCFWDIYLYVGFYPLSAEINN